MIRRQVLVPAPPADVWELITAPDNPDSWLGGHLEWAPEEGGPLRFTGDDGKVRRGVVQAVRPGRYLRYRWWPEDAGDGPASEVAFLLEPDADGEQTRLTVSEQVVPAGVPPASASASSPSPAAGWTAGDDHRLRAWAGTHSLLVRA